MNNMRNADIPDPGEDFDGCVEAVAKEVIAEITAIPEADRPEYFVMRAAQRLYQLKTDKNLSHVTWLLEREKRLLVKRISNLPVYAEDYVPPK
jgi:hypothetical protein